jgi:hypothetical protein
MKAAARREDDAYRLETVIEAKIRGPRDPFLRGLPLKVAPGPHSSSAPVPKPKTCAYSKTCACYSCERQALLPALGRARRAPGAGRPQVAANGRRRSVGPPRFLRSDRTPTISAVSSAPQQNPAAHRLLDQRPEASLGVIAPLPWAGTGAAREMLMRSLPCGLGLERRADADPRGTETPLKRRPSRRAGEIPWKSVASTDAFGP